jgi:signal transduction histidine kinase
MVGLRNSIATRLALGNGALIAALFVAAAAAFYFGTVGVLDRSIDSKISSISARLIRVYGQRPLEELVGEIRRELTDGIDSDTEIFLVTNAAGEPVVGNLSRWPDSSTPLGQLIDRDVVRDGRPSAARLIVQRLPNGGLLYIGRDLSEQRSIRDLVVGALETGAVVALALVIIGAVLFRQQIEARIGAIRRTASEIEAGNLSRRITISGDDEFARLGLDINRMLDRIEHLMEGVRHVSNAIAHDLRTPLTRVRSKLDAALRRQTTQSVLTDAAHATIEEIDDLILVFNKLLQIAEAESGMRTTAFETVDVGRILHDMVDLYDAAAEQRRVQLKVTSEGSVWANGDHDLLANAIASLIDNAIKYAGFGAQVDLSAEADPEGVRITVCDDGPGIPAAEIPRVTERFYRLDQARGLPGNGLGLTIVSAIATLHGGQLRLEPASPGLKVSIMLPPMRRPDQTARIGAASDPSPGSAVTA